MSNIVFIGTPKFAVPILKKINQKYKINCVFTQPPSKSNRGQKFTKSPIHTCAEELNPVSYTHLTLPTKRIV